jgi:hypothetical protein
LRQLGHSGLTDAERGGGGGGGGDDDDDDGGGPHNPPPQPQPERAHTGADYT